MTEIQRECAAAITCGKNVGADDLVGFASGSKTMPERPAIPENYDEESTRTYLDAVRLYEAVTTSLLGVSIPV